MSTLGGYMVHSVSTLTFSKKMILKFPLIAMTNTHSFQCMTQYLIFCILSWESTEAGFIRGQHFFNERGYGTFTEHLFKYNHISALKVSALVVQWIAQSTLTQQSGVRFPEIPQYCSFYQFFQNLRAKKGILAMFSHVCFSTFYYT